MSKRKVFSDKQEEHDVMKLHHILNGVATILYKLSLSDDFTVCVPVVIQQEDGSWIFAQQIGRVVGK